MRFEIEGMLTAQEQHPITKVFLEGHGCSASMADTEILGGLISHGGYELVDQESEADLSVIVTCSVKKVTEDRMVSRIKELTRAGKGRVIVAGCLAKAQPNTVTLISPNLSLIGPSNLNEILPAIRGVLDRRKTVAIESTKLVKLGMPRTRKNDGIGIIEISSGCLNSCTFCQVKLVKGVVFSYPESQIVEEAKTLIAQGAREIWLTSTDNAAYGRDSGTTLPSLIKRISAIQGDFRVRVGMMNPLLTGRILENLVDCFEHEKVFKFLHLPVQSGSDRILKQMQRGYAVSDFVETVKVFRGSIPRITLSTDMIVGFPSETDSEFDESLDLLREARPDIVNISRFGARPGTKAATMDSQLGSDVLKWRSRKMTVLAKQIAQENNESWIGWKGSVLIDEKVKNAVVGRNCAYKPCVLKTTGENFLGTEQQIKVVGHTAFTLSAVLE